MGRWIAKSGIPVVSQGSDVTAALAESKDNAALAKVLQRRCEGRSAKEFALVKDAGSSLDPFEVQPQHVLRDASP